MKLQLLFFHRPINIYNICPIIRIMIARVSFVFLLMLAAVCFSQETELVKARYNVAECYLNATIQAVDAVSYCTDKFNVTVTDLSSQKDLIESDRTALQDASTTPEFDTAWAQAKIDMNDTMQAISDANSSLEGTDQSIGLAKLCYAGQILNISLHGAGCVITEGYTGFAEVAILAYYDESIRRGDYLVSASQDAGLNTTGMESALTYGKSLRPEIVQSFQDKDQARFQNVRLRYGRAVVRFYTEYATALADWAEPRISASDNVNKDDILDKISQIRSNIADINAECPAEYTYDDATDYENQNIQCWTELQTVQSQAKEVIALYRTGATVVVGGEGTVHATGTGNISIFGNGAVNATGSGDLYLTDFNGDSSVSIDVPGVPKPDGSVEYANFTDAQITGSLFTIRISGTITVDAAGKGVVKMQGNGTYYTTPGLSTEGDFTEVG